MRKIKYFNDKNMNNIISNRPDLANNVLIDNNKISLLIYINSFLKILKLIIIIFSFTIILAGIQYIIFVIIDVEK